MKKCCVSGECLNAAAVAFANIIAKDLSEGELDQLALLLNLTGDALGVISATRALCGEEAPHEKIPVR